MDSKIWVAGGWRNIKPEQSVKSFRQVTAFAACNCLPNCLVKAQGGLWRINKDGSMSFISSALNNLTFADLYRVMKQS